MTALRLRQWLARLDPRAGVIGLLAVWAIGLVVATVQLETWQNQLTRTLLQLSADAKFRARVAHQRDQVDPEWYRRKALSLLSAMDKIQHNTAWTLFMPGSWRVFDDLEERLAARLDREFGEIVLETVRRELWARTGKLTGSPQERASGEIRDPSSCAAPSPASGARSFSGKPEDLPEYVALRAYLDALRPLDQAVQSWAALQSPGEAGPEHLRRLVRLTLGAELPGPVSRSVALFNRAADDASAQREAMLAILRTAARCSLFKGMAALHTRLFESNDLLRLEQALAERSAGLFDAGRVLPFPVAVERYRAVAALVQEQEQVLAAGGHGWMRQGALQLGPGYEALMDQARGISLLGPDVQQQAQAQGDQAFRQFRRRFEGLFGGRAPPGIVWQDNQGRFALAPERAALRDGLALLMQEPFMQQRDDAAVVSNPASIEQALAWGDVRRRVIQENLARLPAFARPGVARVVDTRLALITYETALHALQWAQLQDPAAAFDAGVFRARRHRVAQVQALLVSMRSPELAQRLGAQQSSDVLGRLAAAQEEVKALPLLAPRADFSWWKGENAPLLRTFGVPHAAAMQAMLQDQFGRLDAVGRKVEGYLAAADPALAANPAAQRWPPLLQELERYRTRQPDSSMANLERYLLALGPYLRADNCLENLRSLRLPKHQDEVGLRLMQIHNALLQRCMQLRPDPGAAMQTMG